MADSHSNRDAWPQQDEIQEQISRLVRRAEEMTERGENTITAGGMRGLQELPLSEYDVGGMLVRKMPDDPDCLRVSLGDPAPAPGAYLVYRGDIGAAIDLLSRALKACHAVVANELETVKEKR